MATLTNILNNVNSLQVSEVQQITSDTYNSSLPFVLYNNSDQPVQVTITPVSNLNSITIDLQPGWSPILCKSVTVSGTDKIFYGR